VRGELLAVVRAGVSTDRCQQVDVFGDHVIDGRAAMTHGVSNPRGLGGVSASRLDELTSHRGVTQIVIRERGLASGIRVAPQYGEGLRAIATPALTDARHKHKNSHPSQRMAIPGQQDLRFRRSEQWRWRESNPRPVTQYQGFSGCSLL